MGERLVYWHWKIVASFQPKCKYISKRSTKEINNKPSSTPVRNWVPYSNKSHTTLETRHVQSCSTKATACFPNCPCPTYCWLPVFSQAECRLKDKQDIVSMIWSELAGKCFWKRCVTVCPDYLFGHTAHICLIFTLKCFIITLINLNLHTL